MELFATISIPAVICFIVGLIMMIIEMFTPGLGVPGALGIILLIVAVAFQAKSLEEALILLLIVTGIIAGAVAIFIKSASRGMINKSNIILKSENKEQGHDNTALLGKTGVVFSDLRPAGSIRIDQNYYDVVARTGFIGKGTPVKVTEVDGMRIVVEKTEEPS